MAEAKCQFTISRLEWLDDAVEVRCHAVRKAREEILDGTLRNNRGTVSYIFIGRFIARLFIVISFIISQNLNKIFG